ncbi:hypothetical protein MFFC18_25290 [Mariniblastus fucicola]|uniref:Uncharacterized protein n=1 Tax=Mariniblastus fucicola TaxID=980251 RepID=A0A5B9PDI5_9BACT|nr:hypothetical protein MFFC18_25290 [Mariniblastus fucicola]
MLYATLSHMHNVCKCAFGYRRSGWSIPAKSQKKSTTNDQPSLDPCLFIDSAKSPSNDL